MHLFVERFTDLKLPLEAGSSTSDDSSLDGDCDSMRVVKVRYSDNLFLILLDQFVNNKAGTEPSVGNEEHSEIVRINYTKFPSS